MSSSRTNLKNGFLNTFAIGVETSTLEEKQFRKLLLIEIFAQMIQKQEFKFQFLQHNFLSHKFLHKLWILHLKMLINQKLHLSSKFPKTKRLMFIKDAT